MFRCWECDFSLEYYGEIEWVESHGLDMKITKEFEYEKDWNSLNYSKNIDLLQKYLDENKINGIVDVYTRFSKDGVKNSYETIANILGVDAKLFKKVNNNDDKQASNKELKEY